MGSSSNSSIHFSADKEAETAESLYCDPEVDSIFSRCISRWRAALVHAKSSFEIPATSLDLSRCLLHTPRLPENIPSEARWIEGYSTWGNADPSCPLRTRQGRSKRVFLTKLHPTTCDFSASYSFRIWGKHINNGIGMLTLAWAYVLSAELAERQGLPIEYGPLHDAPRATTDLDLTYASTKELRWWMAIVSRGVGWSIAGGRVSPWAVSVDDIGVRISGNATGVQQPPNAQEAACYLSRLCHAYDLGTQASAAFAAALTIPLHAATIPFKAVKIKLPQTRFLVRIGSPHLASPPDEFKLIGYFMTLSLCPWATGPSLWSVFWDADVPCNLVGAWVVPIASLLDPIINSNDMELLARVLSTSNISPLWLGIALCGQGTVINCILPSLTKLRDYPFFRPDTDATAWTGAVQSFFDQSQRPLGSDNTISRADVWRLRHECSSSYSDDGFSYTPPHGWPPFGRMQAIDVEHEIHGHISCSHEWSYRHWTWLLGGTDHGFFMNELPAHQLPEASVHQPLPEMSAAAVSTHHINTAERELIHHISEIATKAVFWWSCGQVERGFGGTIVPYRFGADESIKDDDQPHPVERSLILEWLNTINATTPMDGSEHGCPSRSVTS